MTLKRDEEGYLLPKNCIGYKKWTYENTDLLHRVELDTEGDVLPAYEAYKDGSKGYCIAQPPLFLELSQRDVTYLLKTEVKFFDAQYLYRRLKQCLKL